MNKTSSWSPRGECITMHDHHSVTPEWQTYGYYHNDAYMSHFLRYLFQISTLSCAVTIRRRCSKRRFQRMVIQYRSLLHWHNLRLRCGCVAVAVNLFFNIISWCFAKNVVHSLEPGETPRYSASHQALNYVQRSYISQNTLKRCVAVVVRLRLFFQFT